MMKYFETFVFMFGGASLIEFGVFWIAGVTFTDRLVPAMFTAAMFIAVAVTLHKAVMDHRAKQRMLSELYHHKPGFRGPM